MGALPVTGRWVRTMRPALTTSSMSCLLRSRSSRETPWQTGVDSSAELRSSSTSCLRTSSFIAIGTMHESKDAGPSFCALSF